MPDVGTVESFRGKYLIPAAPAMQKIIEGCLDKMKALIDSSGEVITMSDEQCAERMKVAFTPKPHKESPEINTDARSWHIDADEILCEILLSLGYKKTVEEFEKGEKWYA